MIWVVLGLLAVIALAGCASAGGVSVEGAWARPSPKVADAGAFYMVIKNSGAQADKLVSASCPACGMMELHESYMMADGMMGMRPVEGGTIEIPAGGQVELKVGGLHIMCTQKADAFTLRPAPGWM
jgi:copper(I)-binding protein